MSKSPLFKALETNPEVERDGIIIALGNNSKGKPMEIRVARAGGANDRFGRLVKARMKPYKRQIDNDIISEEVAKRLMREVYAEAVVLGWSNIEDRDCNPLDFSVENCKMLFEQLPALFEIVQEEAQRMASFRAEVLEQEAGNSQPSSSTSST